MNDPLVGQLINGKFRVVAAIGRGGMGKVYRAEQVPLGRAIALKVLRNRPGVSELDPAFQRRFFLEASLCSKLSHPNIVTVYDYGRIEDGSDESYFMAMEFLDGETLHERLRKRGGRLDAAEAARVAMEVLRGLREAHRNGIVHRDLKPGNVMLVPGGESGDRVKIVDFGLVKQTHADNREDLTVEGSFLGSPRYMSPEQIDHGDVDHRADLYSLGVMLYQCLCGKVPFDSPSTMQILMAHASAPVPPMHEKSPNVAVPPALEAFTRRLLEKRPDARFVDADDTMRALRAVEATIGLEGGDRLSIPQQVPDTTRPALSLDAMPAEPSGSLAGASLLSGARPGFTVPPPAGTRSRALPLALAAIGALAFGGTAAVLVRSRTHGGEPVSAKNTAIAPASSAPALAPAPTPPPAVHTLSIESSPTGAEVREGARVLGTTPLTVSLDEAQTGERRFELAMPGYLPVTVAQAPTRENVRVFPMLVPAPAPLNAVAPRAVSTSRAAHVHATTHAAAPTSSTGSPLEIRTTR